MTKQDQSLIINAVIESLELDGKLTKKPIWVPSKNVADFFDKASGRYHSWGCTSNYSVKDDDREALLKAAETAKGFWYCETRPVSYYVHGCTRAFVAINDNEFTAIKACPGHWTMSGEDYVHGDSILVTRGITITR